MYKLKAHIPFFFNNGIIMFFKFNRSSGKIIKKLERRQEKLLSGSWIQKTTLAIHCP